jgi:hypothetical protein
MAFQKHSECRGGRESFARDDERGLAMKRTTIGCLACAALAGALVLSACGTTNGESPDAGDVEQGLDASATRDASTPTPPAFEGGILEDTGVGPAPDGGNDLSGCLDPNDPGGTEPTSKLQTNTDDCDKNKVTVNGVIRGLADTDMYRVSLADKALCRQNSVFKLDGQGLEFCVFVQCKVNGATTDVKSCGGGVKRDSAIGLHGCCAGTPSELKLDWNCTGTIDEQSDVYFRVTPTQNVCQRYSLTYNF